MISWHEKNDQVTPGLRYVQENGQKESQGEAEWASEIQKNLRWASNLICFYRS